MGDETREPVRTSDYIELCGHDGDFYFIQNETKNHWRGLSRIMT